MMKKFLKHLKNEVNKLGFDKVFKISAATRDGVDDLIKEVTRQLSMIPITEMEIPEEERFMPEEKRFTYTIRVEDGVYVVEGSFVDRLLKSVNVNDPDSLRYFHKVLRNKGILDELKEMGIQDEDTVRLNDFEFDFLL